MFAANCFALAILMVVNKRRMDKAIREKAEFLREIDEWGKRNQK